MKLVIVGHGPGAISLASRNREIWNPKEVQVSLLELTKGRIDPNTKISWPDGNFTSLEGCNITSNPEEVIPDATAILFCNPSNSYPEALSKISPYVTDSLKLICAVPGTSGFDWMVREAFVGLNPIFTVGAVESLPFIAKFIDKRENKNEIKVFALKQQLHFAAQPSDDILTQIPLSKILGVKLKVLNSFLSIILSNPSSKVNPILFLEALKHSNTQKERNIYEIDDENEDILESIEKEVKEISKEISLKTGINLDDTLSIRDWFLAVYPEFIEDKSTVRTCLASHNVYSGLKEDFAKGLNENEGITKKSRYLTEQIPYGLVCIKGLAELVEIDTPAINNVIEKCQQYLKVKFLENGSLIKDALKDTAAPQRFGIDVLSKLSRIYLPHSQNYKLETTEFKNHGVTFFGKILSDSSFKEINDKVTEVIKNSELLKNNKVTEAFKNNPEKDAAEESFLNLHWKDPWFAKLCSRPEFVNAACKLLETNEVKIFSSLIITKPPQGKMIVPWHQDAAYDWPLDPIDCASLWLSLDDASIENGSMDMVLGGHRAVLPMKPTSPLSDDEYFFSPRLFDSISEEEISNFPITHCTMLRNECSFHHSMTPHSSLPNRTDRRRCAFIVRYCKGNAKIMSYPGMPREKFFKDYRLFDPKENMAA